MPDRYATRLVSLNTQAIAILRLGIPLDLGLGGDPQQRLREINDRLLVETQAGLSAEALLARHSFPDRYTAIARMLLETDDATPIFESIAVAELDREVVSGPFRQALTEPLVVVGLVYVCLILLCVFTVPHLEAQYIQQGQSPSGATRLLIVMRETMTVWIVGFPLLVLTLWLVWRKSAKAMLLRLSPGGPDYSRWLVAESQSRQLAAMAQSSVDDETALMLASQGASPPVAPRPIAESILRSGNAGNADDPQNRAFAFGRLARFYHFLAADRRLSYFSTVPACVSLFLAASIVFGYALAMFVPWIEVLSNLSGLEAMQP